MNYEPTNDGTDALCVLTSTHLNRHTYDQIPQQDIPRVVAHQFACEGIYNPKR